jgi:peptidoglycan hydrolase-like protein with peptidoglycan-binding domain
MKVFVPASLQQEGYDHGEVDDMLGPLTRSALANYQRNHGLYVTSAIDRTTLESLGMT